LHVFIQNAQRLDVEARAKGLYCTIRQESHAQVQE
jgi:hypothetical protein